MKHPRELDEDLIDAYRARRALDYLVGFTLSPMLWRKLPGAKSAGRVQSVALRLIVDREREIELFRPQEYWQVVATFEADGQPSSPRGWSRFDGKKIDRLTIGDKGDGRRRQGGGRGRPLHASRRSRPSRSRATRRRRSPPRRCSRKRRASSASRPATRCGSRRRSTRTGSITYMRTDGVADGAARRSAPRAGRSPTATTPATCPTSRATTQTKAKNAQEAHEAIRPTDFSRDQRRHRATMRRLYELIFKRALASQMASARLERTTVELTDGAGQGDAARDRPGRALPRLSSRSTRKAATRRRRTRKARACRALRAGRRAGQDAAVEATQHFTQPPPRYSEASLVKRLEELGIGRPSTYAATLQTLKDREYVRLEKNRFIPEESGRLVTAFLERFFERYVSYDYTAELEEELDDVSGGRLDWQEVLEDFWRDFKPKAGEVMEQKPSEVTAALDDFLAPWLFPDKGDGSDPRALPGLRQRAAVAARRQVRRVRRLLQLSRVQVSPAVRPGRRRRRAASDGPGEHPANGDRRCARPAASGPMSSWARARTPSAPRSPRTCRRRLDLEMAQQAAVAAARRSARIRRPASRSPPSIGRYGPYLAHDGKYAQARLDRRGVRDRHERGGGQARRSGGRRRARRGGSREPITVLGAASDAAASEIKVMEGRYGPYVTDGTTHATLPKTADPKAVTLEEAVALIDAKAAKGPSKGKRRGSRPGRRRARAAQVRAGSGPSADADLPPVEAQAVEQEQAAGDVLADADDGADRHQRREAADGRRQRAEHAQLGAGVAIVGIERVADEAAIAGLVRLPAAEQRDLALELGRRRGDQRDAERVQRVADDQPRREIVAAVDDQVMA